MADLDDEAIIVSLPDEGDGAVITKVEGDKPKPKDDPIDDLKSQFDALKNQNQTLTQRLNTAETTSQQTARQLEETNRELQTTKSAVTDSQLDTVLTGIQKAESDASAAEAAFIAAAEAGDYAAQARAQRRISAAETTLQRLQEAKGDLEEAKTSKPVQRTEAPQPRPQAADPVETVIRNGNIPQKSANWLRAHPDCITDPDKNRRMLAAHNLAMIDDIVPESDEYFERIESAVNKAKAAPKPEPAKPDASGKRPMSAAASGTNSGGGMNGGGTQVSLSRGEVEAANDGTVCWNYDDPKGKFKKGDPVGTTEFARRKMIMQKQGLYDKTLSS